MHYKLKKIFKIIKCYFLYLFYVFYCNIKKINNDDVWLISERGVDARDNGYHFYKYLKKYHPNIKVKYVISKKSADRYKIDNSDIVFYNSREHYILFLTSKYLISTHIMGYSPDMSLFWRMDKKGLLNIKGYKIFLQHGIIGNYEPSLESSSTNVDLFITSAKKEYNFILHKCHYSPKVLKCTGLSRYDNLKSNEKKQILIMPTFRKWLNYDSNFEYSEYYIKWNSLLNNKKLIDYLEEKKLKLIFYPHYEIQKYIKYFKSESDNVIVADFNNYDVQKLLIESKLLITDYSSVQFDFAYMEKHIIYYQFDKEKFFNNHYKKGYFDYEKDGFGPVCLTEDDLVNKIICESFSSYDGRSKSFFAFNDTNNSKRIYDEIKKL